MLNIMENEKNQPFMKASFTVLFIGQIIGFVGEFLSARTPLMWFWGILSFIPPFAICLSTTEKKYVLSSLLLFFVSQQAIWVFANQPWGFAFGSDAVNDLQTASILMDTNHFDLGLLGYTQRASYSYYPLVHLFGVVFSKATGISLSFIAVYIVPFISTALVSFALYGLNGTFFQLSGYARGFATLLFQTCFYYTAFQWQFIREIYAFPLTLFALWFSSRVANNFDKKDILLAALLIFAVILSHQMSSYLLFILLAVMTISFSVFRKNHRLWVLMIFTTLVLGLYTTFVTYSFSMTELGYTSNAIQAIFQRQEPVTVLRQASSSNVYLTYTYYIVLAALAFVGLVSLFRTKPRRWEKISIIVSLAAAFVFCVILRLSISANPWDWTYYMALRGTIWGFIGLSVAASLGIFALFKSKRARKAVVAGSLILICILAAGKFSQYSSLITSTDHTPVTLDRYIASEWLKTASTHGSNMLVASYKVDNDGFEASRSMAPYAFLREYFLDDYHNFSLTQYYGYIPFVGSSYEKYSVDPQVGLIYSNGDTEIGYKG